MKQKLNQKLNSYLHRILNARVYDVADETPLLHAQKLSKRTGNTVLLKREDMQPTFAFKVRGSYNKLYQLNQQGDVKTVITASAGNHAQGVALGANKLGMKAIIVMPVTTPGIKVQAVRDFGARIILHGDTYDEAYAHAHELGSKQGYPFVHPYDDPDVIAGQGTIAMEMLRQHDKIDVVFIPVGGGGLIAGMAAYFKAVRPDIKVVAVEAADSACLHEALKAKRRVTLPSVGIFADGVAVRQVGKEPYSLLKDIVDDTVLVTTDEICAAIKDIYDDTRSIAEPAGALATAAIKQYAESHKLQGQNLAGIICGANMNFDRLRHVAERAELGENREMLMAVTIPEKPGSFKQFCAAIGKRSVTEFNYRYASEQAAQIFVGVMLNSSDDKERQQVIKRLEAKKFPVTDLSQNEMAKTHIRYMVGGRVNDLADEKVYRLQFPERPGALMQFLNGVGGQWNISMFHYRNHGAAYGRVLLGIQLPNKADVSAFKKTVAKLGYQCWDETDNPAYKQFLS